MAGKSTYKAPRLVFADETAAKIYAEKYPEIEKMIGEMSEQKCAAMGVATLDVATATLDSCAFKKS